MTCDLTKYMPAMLTGDELLRAMTILPEYDAAVRNKPAAERLMELSSLYQLYLPSTMSLEIYSKLYLALMRSLRKKSSRSAILQKYENLKAIKQQEYEGIIGGSDSFTMHRCFLCDSPVLITSKGSPSLECAEMLVPYSMEAAPCENELECSVAEYVHAVFQSPMDMDTDIPVGRFFHSRLEYTMYLSPRGEQRNMAVLFADYAAFYACLHNQPLDQQWKLQKMFCSDRLNAYEVCLVGMFLGVSPEELTQMTLPQVSQPEWFDKKIRTLHEQGLKYPEIARIMGAPYDVVKFIGNKR